MVVLVGLPWLASAAPLRACALTRLVPDPLPPADVVFTGTVVRVDEGRGLFNSGLFVEHETVRWTFAVDGVESGSGARRLTIQAIRSSCSPQFLLGQRYRVRAVVSPLGLNTWLGAGNEQIEPLAFPPPVEASAVDLIAVLVIAVAALVAIRLFRQRGKPQTTP